MYRSIYVYVYVYIYIQIYAYARGSHLACSSPPPRVLPPVPCSWPRALLLQGLRRRHQGAEVDARRGARQDRRALRRARVNPAASSQTARPCTPTRAWLPPARSAWSGFPADLWYYEPAKNLGTEIVAAFGEAEVAQAAAEAKEEADLLKLEAADAVARLQGMGV